MNPKPELLVGLHGLGDLRDRGRALRGPAGVGVAAELLLLAQLGQVGQHLEEHVIAVDGLCPRGEGWVVRGIPGDRRGLGHRVGLAQASEHRLERLVVGDLAPGEHLDAHPLAPELVLAAQVLVLELGRRGLDRAVELADRRVGLVRGEEIEQAKVGVDLANPVALLGAKAVLDLVELLGEVAIGVVADREPVGLGDPPDDLLDLVALRQAGREVDDRQHARIGDRITNLADRLLALADIGQPLAGINLPQQGLERVAGRVGRNLRDIVGRVLLVLWRSAVDGHPLAQPLLAGGAGAKS